MTRRPARDRDDPLCQAKRSVLLVPWSRRRGTDSGAVVLLPPPPPFFLFFSLLELNANSPKDLSLSVIKRESKMETDRERDTEESQSKKCWTRKKEKINVSSLLQIRRRLKSQRNPRGNPVWFAGLLV